MSVFWGYAERIQEGEVLSNVIHFPSTMRPIHLIPILALSSTATAAYFAVSVPNEIQQPGTQPLEVLAIEDSENCQGCHGHFDMAMEPYRNWGGSMMAHAGRDPIFWAAMAIAEQDFDGAGDLCLRCHSPKGWMEDRSTPTDGSGLDPQLDGDGIECMVCHRLTNPDGSEHLGVQNAPFIANTGGANPEPFLGSGQMVLADGIDRHGPRGSVAAPHPVVKSDFVRSSAMCGTCHDVSNPLVGDLAHNNGIDGGLPVGKFDGTLGGPLSAKAAFQNKPHGYGVVERTYSEHVASGLDDYLVKDYNLLPNEIQGGIMRDIYDAAQIAGTGGDYEDGTPRAYTCQSCHMRPTAGQSTTYPGAPWRLDLATHDLTGGNTRVGDMIINLDNSNRLMVGGGLDVRDRRAIRDAQDRAREMLKSAAKLEVVGNTVKVYNLTGHKLTSGYPEGRRMWLNIRWWDANDQMIREDGAYDDLYVDLGAVQGNVKTLVDLHDPNTTVWEVKPGITQEWAAQLIGLGYDPNIPLQFDRVNSAVTLTLGGLANMPAGSVEESFHFALSNTVISDNRIPPYRMDYDQAKLAGCLPVPDTQFGNPGAGGVYENWDEVTLNPPAGAARADIRLMYQITSYEYLQFLYLANDGSVPHLANTGRDLLRAWYQTGMAEPEIMARRGW